MCYRLRIIARYDVSSVTLENVDAYDDLIRSDVTVSFGVNDGLIIEPSVVGTGDVAAIGVRCGGVTA